MRNQVVVLPLGGCEALMAWTEKVGIPSSGKGGGDVGSKWVKLCRRIVEFARSRDARHDTEVFLCLLGDCNSASADRDSLSQLLSQARNHSWASRLFFATPRLLHLPDMLRAGRESWRLWLRQALADKVLDCLQIDYDSGRPKSILQLRRAANRASLRHEILAAYQSADGQWRCVTENRLLRSLLSPLVLYDQAADPAAHVLIVTERSLPEDQVNEVEKLYKAHQRPGRRFLVATLRGAKPETELDDNGRTEDRSPLDELCARHELPEPLDLQGALELWYFLLRLNEGPPQLPSRAREVVANPPAPAEAWRSYHRIRAVTPVGEPVFLPRDAAGGPAIAITSAFDPAELEQLLNAAQDVGEFVKLCPIGARLLVEPAINLHRLFQVMERIPDFDVWIHLGHGDGADGFEEAITGQYAPPDLWLQAFLGRKFRLSLAMFLTCLSSPIAERFAQAGAGVAIGLQYEVESDKCRELAVDVLKAILVNGTSQEVILHGFYLGCNRIEVQQQIPSDPIAFYPKRA